MGYADGREPEHGAEVQRHSRAARVIAACRVDEQHVRWERERADGRLD